ncbi:MAG: DUF1934 domain-containing protein [Clostridiales bacterium]|nr:DUF1934 domain-containing protein [Clostridiales bacterium]
MKQPLTIHLTTVQHDIGEAALFEQMSQTSHIDFVRLAQSAQEQQETEERFEMYVRGEAEVKNGTFVLRYMETELTGMAGTETTISFDVHNRDCVTLLRSGEVKTALTFLKGQRSISTYDTPQIPFSLCVYTMHMKNDLQLTGGSLVLEYLVEIRGAFAQHNRLVLQITPVREDEAEVFPASDEKKVSDRSDEMDVSEKI